jgi:hypothetical protein
MIDLKISTDDECKRELIRRYWKLAVNGSGFAESMETLKEDFGLSRGAILGIVRSNSRAVSKIHQCECGHRKTFDSRKDFRSTPKQKPFVCPKCRENGAANGAEASGGSSSKPGRSDEQGDASEGAPAEAPDGQLPANEGSPEELQDSLRKLARVLSEASQRVERLSHKMDG